VQLEAAHLVALVGADACPLGNLVGNQDFLGSVSMIPESPAYSIIVRNRDVCTDSNKDCALSRRQDHSRGGSKKGRKSDATNPEQEFNSSPSLFLSRNGRDW
jgi:hypothetical protein